MHPLVIDERQNPCFAEQEESAPREGALPFRHWWQRTFGKKSGLPAMASDIPVDIAAVNPAVQPAGGPGDPAAGPSRSAAAEPAKAHPAADATVTPIGEAHRHTIYLQCLRLMRGHTADAEDATNTAILNFVQFTRGGSQPVGNSLAYLRRAAHNACMDLYRGRQRNDIWMTDVDLDNLPEEDGLPWMPTVQSPEDILLRRELAATLARAIEALPTQLRQPFLMRMEQGLDYERIAQALGISNANARKRVQLARTVLRSVVDRRF